jgi:hypothetical protein
MLRLQLGHTILFYLKLVPQLGHLKNISGENHCDR